MRIREFLQALILEEEGATMLEYAIMAGFIAAVCAATVALLGTEVMELYVVPGFTG